MNVDLPPELENVVRQSIASGRYTDASEVMREALRCWVKVRADHDLARAEAAKGFDQLHHGKSAPLDMNRAKQNAIANAEARRIVSPLVKP